MTDQTTSQELTVASVTGVIVTCESATVEKYWDGKWTRETRSTSYDASGCRVETVTAEASDMPGSVVTSETVYYFLGREISVTTPLTVTSNFYGGASDRVARVSRTGQPDTLYGYEAGSAGVPARTALDSDGDGWPDWKELLAGTATNDMFSGPVNTGGPQTQVPVLFEATVTLNADLPCNALLRVGDRTVVLRQAGSCTLTLVEGVAYPVSVTASQPCAVSLSCSLSSAFAAFQDPGGVFSGGATVPGGVPVACGMIAQPVLKILPAAVCFHSEDPKTVAAKVTPAMAGSYHWYWYGGPISANGGKSANISWGGGAGFVSVTFTASGAAQPRYAEREVTKCQRVEEDTWCDEHLCEHWYCACDDAGAGDDDDCWFHGQKVSKCKEAVCPRHDCPYAECPEDWCHEHDCLYTGCYDLHYHPGDYGGDPSGSGGNGGPGGDDPPETPPETPPDGDMETEGWILLNDDDDNADGSDDRYDEYPAADHDLRPVWPLGSFSGVCCPCPAHRGAEGWRARLESCSDGLRVFRGSDKTGPVSVGDLFYPGERVYVEGYAASASVSSESLHWELKNPGDVNAGTFELANKFSVLSLRLTGDYTLDGAVDDDDRATEPGLSETYGWGIPAATNVFRLVRLSTESHLGGVYTLSLEGDAGAIKIWATGSPGPGGAPLLVCGQTVADGVNGADFTGYPGCGLYIEALRNTTATLTYKFRDTGDAAGIYYETTRKLTAWDVGIAMDGDRNGEISFASTNDTSCVFWVNDDHDGLHYEENEWHEDDSLDWADGADTPNCDDDRIGAKGYFGGNPPSESENNCTRDLAEDYALHSASAGSWEQNNKLKPDMNYNYEGPVDVYDTSAQPTPSRFYYDSLIPFDERTLAFTNDTHEIFAYAAESRGAALGVQSSLTDFTLFDLAASPLSYTGAHYSHSRQFRSNVLEEGAYWDKVLQDCHKPDKRSPILYLIRKKESEQSILIERNDVSFNFKSDGSNNVRGYDFLESRLTGNVARNSDSVKSPYCDLQAMASLNTNTSTWTVTLRACGTNDGIIVSDKKLYVAPTTGYAREYSFSLEDHKPPEKKFIYVSSRNGAVYTRMEIYSVGAMDASAWVTAMSATNPFGNPNLEPATGVPSGLIVQMRKEVRDSFRNDKRPPNPDLPKRIKEFNEKLAKEKAR